MLQAVPHAIGFVLPPIIVLSARMGGAWTFLPVGLPYVALPALDALSGLNPENPEEAAPALGANPWRRVMDPRVIAWRARL